VSDKSAVDIIGEVEADATQIRLRFSETLCFNIPLQPKVPLTGTLVLQRGSDGLITKYREVWDQGVWGTLSKTYL
jgi:hypothetical protein